MTPECSKDKRLTDVDTRNCYICKIAQYFASREALLRAIMYALVQADFLFLNPYVHSHQASGPNGW